MLTVRMNLIAEEIGDYIFSCCTKSNDDIVVGISKPKNYVGNPKVTAKIMSLVADIFTPEIKSLCFSGANRDLIFDEEHVRFIKQSIGTSIITLYKEEMERRERVKEND